MECALAIDLGTGGPKVAVVSVEGRSLASASAPVATHFVPGGGAEQDPREWWRAIAQAARAAVARSGCSARDFVAACCTAQYSSTVAVDAAGEPLMNAVLWLDSRGGKYNREILNRENFLLWVELHGLPPTSGGADGLGHVLFLKHERPEVYARARAFLEPIDYVNLRLTGRIAATQSTAFPFLLIDNRELGATSWCDELVKRAGVDPAKLPELLPFDAIVGPLLPAAAADLGVAAGIPVVMGCNDSITAAIGTGALTPERGTLIVGTTSVLVCHVSHKATDAEHAVLSVPSPVPGRYFVMAENGVGGRALELFLRNVIFADDGLGTGQLPEDAYARAERAAAAAPAGSGGVLFLPWLAGSIAPRPDEHVRGGFLNLGLESTRAHLLRAVFEGVALNFAWLRPHVEKFAGARFGSLRFAGGGALSDLWAQIHADVLGVPVEQLEDARNTNARGAAFLAFERLGRLRFADIPGLLQIRRTYEPNPGHRALYDRLTRELEAAHEHTAEICAALNARRGD